MELLDSGTPDKLDRYRLHFLKGYKLKKTELLMLEKYRKSHTLLCAGYSKSNVVTIISKEYEISEPQAYLIIREAQKLYGDVAEADKKGMRHILLEQTMMVFQIARKAGDTQGMTKCIEIAAKLNGAFEPDQDLPDVADFVKPSTVIFTNNITILKNGETPPPPQEPEDTYELTP